MRGKTPRKLAVGAAAIVLLAAAGCSGDDTGGTTDPNANKGGDLRVMSGEPESLMTTNGAESEGIAVMRQLYAGLVAYNADSGKPENVIAESIESTDQKKWTIKLKSNFKFTNGEAVNADAFIRAWNFGAYGPNVQGNSYFYDRIEGYADLQSEDPDGEEGPQKAPEPKAKEMSGLKKLDDNSFEVNLAEPFAGFPTMLGYVAFMPLADACVKDAKACNETPIGNGPFKMDGAWEHKVQIKTVRNDEYAGTKANVDKLTFKIYDNIETGYNDFQAGELDIIDTVPPAKYKEAKAQYGEKMIEKPTTSLTYLGFPLYKPQFANKKLRQAFSMAIDRQAIIDAVFAGQRTPAKSIAPSLIPGSRETACAYCQTDATKAKQLLAEAGGWPGGKAEFWFNAGAGHEVWVQGVADQIKKNLGVDFTMKGQLQFAEYLATGDKKGFTGPFRLGWGADYPLLENYLKPLFGKSGSSNYPKYDNAEFDSLIAQGDGAASLDEANTFYQKAEDMVMEDMPVIPLWFGQSSSVTGEKVKSITFNRIEELDYATAVMVK
ncbi:MAG TPA: ABC transporter substrate-binding protein [Pilimelia sp.]|nr:ABC transporter substrate-binding protein [Pilimelia sp.]